MTMSVSEVRQAITALNQLAAMLKQSTKYGTFLEDAVAALDGDRTFTGYSKLSNTAANMLEDITTHPPLRNALSSLAYHGYQYCVEHSKGPSDFTQSMSRAETAAQGLGGLVNVSDALEVIRKHLDAARLDDNRMAGISLLDAGIANSDVDEPQPSGTARSEQRRFFDEAVSAPLARRLSERLVQWRASEGEDVKNKETEVFQKRLRTLLDTGEEGRRFGDFAILDHDLADLQHDLEMLVVPKRPQEVLERAQVCRNLTSVEFKSADASLYRSSRRCWLASAFWNSALTELWATNEEQFVYDILGYLTVIQAEHRYATHIEDVLLLLRVSHLICRIASSEELIPTNFYEKFDRIEAWVRYTVGTVLAISGPGRVPPSRINNDPRLIDDNGHERSRDEFGEILLPLWRSPDEREAASAILLELAGWKISGALRLLRSTLGDTGAQFEVWAGALTAVVTRAARVKVLRPNPWADSKVGKLITADRHALAVLASEVIHRIFPSLQSRISLNGTSFRDRRVPTFVCSADFGPLGLFKADARDRIAREAENFTQYAQQLHPRYRASRCDKSVATISEPDDRIEFVSGLLTSYVFTAREAPRSLNSWFQSSESSVVLGLVEELFQEALKPWYQHATLGMLDILSEYAEFSRGGLTRLQVALSARNDLEAPDMSALLWLDAIIGWVTGEAPTVDRAIEEQAARLQLCETLRAVTHGDLHLDNVMVLGKTGAESPCLIDFEATSEAHLLRDFGRFTGAVLFRTCDWSDEESKQIREAVGRGITSEFEALAPKTGDESASVTKALDVIDTVWRSYGQHWHWDSRPGILEVVATLVCSFLPFARYPDTASSGARLALSLAGDLVRYVWAPTS
jgi:Phosphotransferase enzyme family